MLTVVKDFVKILLSKLTEVSSVVLIGSNSTGFGLEDSSDVDVVVLIDDTNGVDKQYLISFIRRLATQINIALHCQVYFLSEFWSHVENGSPITFTILRDSVIYYDTGFFTVLQKLVRNKIIKPKQIAVERQLKIAKQLMRMTYHSVNRGLIQNLEGAIISSTQSLLMEMGVEPPAPKQTPNMIKQYLVDKKILSEEYYTIAKNVIQTYKDIEHNKRQNLSGQELQKMYNETNKFVNQIEQLLSDIRTKR